MRPLLLSGGLALIWFAHFQGGGIEGDIPAWGVAAVLMVRLLLDFVGAWLALSIARLVLMLGRIALFRLHAGR